MKKNAYFPFYVFAFTVAIALTLPVLLKDGMFFDAVLYQSVAHNMALGMGSFWFPYFDSDNLATLPSFHEQPPLVFFIQSIFYRLLGSSMYVERFYALIMLFINAFLILKIWKTIFQQNEKMKHMGWLAIILWITIPVCFWSFSNCMNEITMSVFTSLSILFFVKYYYQTPKNIYLFLGGIMTVLAFMSKGFPGLYPIGFSFFYWLCTKKIIFKQMILHTCLALSVLLAFALFVWFNANAHKSIIDYYLIKRCFQRISEVPTTDSRWFILLRLFSELIPVFILTALLFIVNKIKQQTNLFVTYKNEFLLFLLVGFSGSLPLMLTTVQKGFYMVATLQNFGIAFAILLAPILHYFINKNIEHNYKTFTIIASGLFFLVLIFSGLQIGKFSREKDKLHDVYAIKKILPKHSYIQAASAVEVNDYSFQMYMMRYNNIEIQKDKTSYLFIQKGKEIADKNSFQKINIETKEYDFYKRIQ